jgi:hypothetical protein
MGAHDQPGSYRTQAQASCGGHPRGQVCCAQCTGDRTADDEPFLRRHRTREVVRPHGRARARGSDASRAVDDARSRRAPRHSRARPPRRTGVGRAWRLGSHGRTPPAGGHGEGLRHAPRDDSIGTAARLLSHRVGAPRPEPQRVLRPPRGRPESQPSRSTDEPPRPGRRTISRRTSSFANTTPGPRPGSSSPVHGVALPSVAERHSLGGSTPPCS